MRPLWQITGKERYQLIQLRSSQVCLKISHNLEFFSSEMVYRVVNQFHMIVEGDMTRNHQCDSTNRSLQMYIQIMCPSV